MNELAQSISRLYEPDSAPVVGVSGGQILFCNSAASVVFEEIAPGMRAADILPDSFLRCDEEVFVATARLKERAVSASGVWFSGLLLLRLNLAPAEYEFSAESFTAGMRAELAAMRIALEQMSTDASEAFTEMNGASLAVLRHSYYKLLRRCENTALAHDLTNRIAVYKPLLLDPAEWLSDLIAQLKEPLEKLGVKLQFTRPANIGEIPADRALLEQMLLNLVSNARKQLNPGGTITFRMSRQGRRLQLAVEDSGPGFSGEQLRGLYQRSVLSAQESAFRRERLGLLIVWGVADLHGGSVTVMNRSHSGACVRITLPTEQPGYQLRTPTEPYRARYPENEHILTALSDVLPDDCYPLDAAD